MNEGTVEAFFPRVAKAGARALLLDYDGTLAPFRTERDQAVPYPGVREHLEGILAAGHTRLVVVTGRTVEDVLPLLGLEGRPEIWGCHGWERLLPHGRYELAPIPPAAARGLEEGARWVEAQGWLPRLERKPASLALHWRGLDPRLAGAIHGKAQGGWRAIAAECGLAVQGFDGGLELRVPGRDKGAAVQTVLREMGDGCAMAYLGDDQTDEDAFRAIRNEGLGVLVRRQRRTTEADAWIHPPEGLLSFLARWREACGEEVAAK